MRVANITTLIQRVLKRPCVSAKSCVSSESVPEEVELFCNRRKTIPRICPSMLRNSDSKDYAISAAMILILLTLPVIKNVLLIVITM